MELTPEILRLHIDALHSEFAWRIDRGDPATVFELFTLDGSYTRSTGESSHGHEQIRAAYATRTSLGPRTARHVFTNLRLYEIEKTRAKGSCILTLFAEDGLPPRRAEPLLVADFDDEFECDLTGLWRYKKRLITWIFTRPEGGLGRTLPLGEKGLKV